MPKKSWASEEQKTWLLTQLADFWKAQEAKAVPSFFIGLYEDFHKEWPVAPPDADELSKADGNEDMAKTIKEKASEVVSSSFPLHIVGCMTYPYY